MQIDLNVQLIEVATAAFSHFHSVLRPFDRRRTRRTEDDRDELEKSTINQFENVAHNLSWTLHELFDSDGKEHLK